MNERIKELAEQAGIRPYMDTLTGGVDANGYLLSTPNWETLDPNIIKFAELLVTECASIAGKAEYSDTWSEPVEDTIKKHFGVEE